MPVRLDDDTLKMFQMRYLFNQLNPFNNLCTLNLQKTQVHLIEQCFPFSQVMHFKLTKKSKALD